VTRQSTNQARQRAKVSQRRRRRGPADVMTHGLRSQSGIRIRSHAAWQAYHKVLVAEARRLDKLKAVWRGRAQAKRGDG
jgi:hypothetical protein